MRNPGQKLGYALIGFGVAALLVLWLSGSGRLGSGDPRLTAGAGLIGFALPGAGWLFLAQKPARRLPRPGKARSQKHNLVVASMFVALSLLLLGLGFREAVKPGEPGPMMGVGILGLIMTPFAAAKLLHASSVVRLAGAMRSGRSAIARWTVPPEELSRYRENDQGFTSRGTPNIYGLPSHVPDGGLEVIFSADGVLIGELMTNQGSRVAGVRLIASDPPTIEFDLVRKRRTGVTGASGAIHSSLHRTWGTLRVPVARQATLQGAKVMQQYQSVVGSLA